jgi:cyclohexanone monooxygenase
LPGPAVDVVIVGAGFAGLYALYRLRALGLRCAVIEAGSDVGGTWYWNRYPGARCDIESVEYSYSFSPELEQQWDWHERFAAQPDILRYLQHVADRFDLRRDIRFDTRVTSARFVRARAVWQLQTQCGDSLEARWLVMATGCLSSAKLPDIEGRESFAGPAYHSGNWPHQSVDFTGQTVAVIGTGSTAIQLIPQLAEQAARLLVFQRTPNFSLPAQNRPLGDDDRREAKARYAEIRSKARRSSAGVAYFPVATQSALEIPADERERMLEAAWQRGGTGIGRLFTDTMTRPEANQIVADFVRRKISQKLSKPLLAEKVLPHNHPIGTKRICLDTGYFEALSKRNVTLIDARDEPIVSIDATGVRTTRSHHVVDALVFATGFDAMTGALLSIDIRTDDGVMLSDLWANGPASYLGLAVAGLPNLFTVTGPGSPSVLSNMVVSIEQHVEWITDCIGWMRRAGHTRIEATPHAQAAWVEHVNALADATLFPQALSWYTGANVPGKPRVFMPYVGGVGAYREKCAAVAAAGYEGFSIGR